MYLGLEPSSRTFAGELTLFLRSKHRPSPTDSQTSSSPATRSDPGWANKINRAPVSLLWGYWPSWCRRTRTTETRGWKTLEGIVTALIICVKSFWGRQRVFYVRRMYWRDVLTQATVVCGVPPHSLLCVCLSLICVLKSLMYCVWSVKLRRTRAEYGNIPRFDESW